MLIVSNKKEGVISMRKEQSQEPTKTFPLYPESALCEEPVHPGEGGYGYAARPKADGSFDYSDGIVGKAQHFVVG